MIPWEGRINITVNTKKKTVFTLKLRIPGWAGNKAVPSDLYSYLTNNDEKIELKINGKDEQLLVNKGYIEITKEWTKVDMLEMVIPMTIRKVVANKKLEDDINKIAFEYGPIVYCAEEIDNGQISKISIPDNLTLNIVSKTILSD